MEELEFEWEAEKARTNARKHGVTFTEGATVFRDRLARLMAERTVDDERRQVMVGLSALGCRLRRSRTHPHNQHAASNAV